MNMIFILLYKNIKIMLNWNYIYQVILAGNKSQKTFTIK